jgi:hypothetical protein
MWIDRSPRTIVIAALFAALAGCGALEPSPTPTINDKISWTGKVFEERDLADVEQHLSEDSARALVAEYGQPLEIVAIHAGELAPNVSGPTYLGYVVEVARPSGDEALPILINAEKGEIVAGPGADTADGDQDQ